MTGGPPAAPSSERAKLYRARAAEIRVALGAVFDTQARLTLMELAKSYDDLAAMLEKRSDRAMPDASYRPSRDDPDPQLP
jgi:hypothetical protein